LAVHRTRTSFAAVTAVFIRAVRAGVSFFPAIATLVPFAGTGRGSMLRRVSVRPVEVRL
jgi:hypothetical protein